MKILVVEDEPSYSKLARLVLTGSGHDVAEAGAVDRAIEEIERCEPELILLDLGLPGIDGLRLARLLKADPARKHIAIIAITAFPERYSAEDALAAGCDSYLVKPIDTRALPLQVEGVAARMR